MFYIARIGILDHFCSCELHLNSKTFIYKLHPHQLEIYWICIYEHPTSKLSKFIIWWTV